MDQDGFKSIIEHYHKIVARKVLNALDKNEPMLKINLRKKIIENFITWNSDAYIVVLETVLTKMVSCQLQGFGSCALLKISRTINSVFKDYLFSNQ